MRVSGQLAVIAMLGAAGIGGWYAYQGGHLAKIPVIGTYVSQPAERQAAQGGRGRGPAGPATVDVDTVRTGRIVEVPVIWIAPADDPQVRSLIEAGLSVTDGGPIVVHPNHPDDVAVVKSIWSRLGAGLDAAEPFIRIRDAVIEARKMGVTHRAAG